MMIAARSTLTRQSAVPYHQIMEYSKGYSATVRFIGTAKALLISMRPRQWSKNLIIYLAFFFTVNEAWQLSNVWGALPLFGKSTLAFVIFSALTGAVYLINDIYDVERDRRHPRKRFRPLASGLLPIPVAWMASVMLILIGLGAAFAFEPLFGAVSLAYVLSMIAYSMAIKHQVLIDVITISAGFILRAVAGAIVMQVPISPWLYICTGLAALLLALAKRRSELALAGGNATSQRDALGHYTIGLLDQLIAMVATAAVLAYSLYTFTAANLPQNHSMMLTIPFVVYGLFRYIYLVRMEDSGENPEDLLIGDKPLASSIVLWLVSAGVILSVFRG